MKNKKINLVIFLLSVLTLVISLKLFYNMAIYSDEYNSSPVLVSGGWFWLSMGWLRLALLVVISILSGMKLLR